eukprot:scaffold439483_cov23-Prasinocladus_malaysianus.AAC.2
MACTNIKHDMQMYSGYVLRANACLIIRQNVAATTSAARMNGANNVTETLYIYAACMVMRRVRHVKQRLS